MRPPAYRRKLSAILYADVHEFSRLMTADESRTVRQLTANRTTINNTIDEYRGRTVDMTGDSVLAEFQSAVHAVECAVAIQQRIHRANSVLTEDHRMSFRIGVNIGDILVEPRGIFGEAVNIAARLQTLARPGGICISGAVYRAVKSKLRLQYDYLGERSFKNIAEMISTYRVTLAHDPSKAETEQRSERNSLAHSHISIAILPFTNLSATTRLAYFGDAVTEDISMGLSKFREVSVIAKDSSFFFKGDSEFMRRLCQDLGIHYVLDGSIRRIDDRARILIRLTNADTGEIIWGDRFDREIDELSVSSDDLMQTIVSTVIVNIEQVEQKIAAQGSLKDPTAYQIYLLGQQLSRRFTEENNRHARQMYEEAIRLNPEFARAYAALSRTHNFDWRYSWSESPEESLRTALELARKSVELDVQDARGHSELGFVYLFMKQHKLAIAEYERGLGINPNDTEVMADMADALSYVGRCEEAIELLKTSLRLNPMNPDWRLWSLGDAYYTIKDYRAVINTMNCMHDPSESHRLLAASYAQLGMMKDARTHATEVLRHQPDFAASRWAEIQPDANPENAEHYLEGLEKAGL